MKLKTPNESRNLMTKQILNETLGLTTPPKKWGGGHELVSANNLDFILWPNVHLSFLSHFCACTGHCIIPVS